MYPRSLIFNIHSQSAYSRMRHNSRRITQTACARANRVATTPAHAYGGSQGFRSPVKFTPPQAVAQTTVRRLGKFAPRNCLCRHSTTNDGKIITRRPCNARTVTALSVLAGPLGMPAKTPKRPSAQKKPKTEHRPVRFLSLSANGWGMMV